MRPPNGNAALAGTALENNIALREHQNDSTASCGKAATVSLYVYGILPLESCQRLFNRNPAWRSA